jgi:hypothetical protein
LQIVAIKMTMASDQGRFQLYWLLGWCLKQIDTIYF